MKKDKIEVEEVGKEVEVEVKEDMEEEKEKFDFVVSRAVMPLPDLVRIVRKNISRRQRNAIANGILCLKGGDISQETSPFHRIAETYDLHEWAGDSWFEGKYMIYLPI